MRCGDYEELISAYADGELQGAARADLEAHISVCGECRRLYEQTLRLQGDIASVLAECGPTPDVVRAVTARIRPARRFHMAWAWAAAAVMLIAVCSYALLRPAPARLHAEVVAQSSHHRPAKTSERKAVPNIQHGCDPLPKAEAKESSDTARLPHRAPKSTRPGPPPTVAAEIAADRAEITVEYTDGDAAAVRATDVAATSPIAGPGQRVTASTEVVTVHGKPVERVCYRIDQGERNGTD